MVFIQVLLSFLLASFSGVEYCYLYYFVFIIYEVFLPILFILAKRTRKVSHDRKELKDDSRLHGSQEGKIYFHHSHYYKSLSCFYFFVVNHQRRVPQNHKESMDFRSNDAQKGDK